MNPDIWYTVLIYEYNVDDKTSPTAVRFNCTDCTDIVDTSYTFTPDYPSPCVQYFFTVIPYNGAGEGEPSPNTIGHAISESNSSGDYSVN